MPSPLSFGILLQRHGIQRNSEQFHLLCIGLHSDSFLLQRNGCRTLGFCPVAPRFRHRDREQLPHLGTCVYGVRRRRLRYIHAEQGSDCTTLQGFLVMRLQRTRFGRFSTMRPNSTFRRNSSISTPFRSRSKIRSGVHCVRRRKWTHRDSHPAGSRMAEVALGRRGAL